MENRLLARGAGIVVFSTFCSPLILLFVRLFKPSESIQLQTLSYPFCATHRSQVVLDADGKEHLIMRFFVEGPNNEGTAHLEMVKDQRGSWEYKYLFVDIPGTSNGRQRWTNAYVNAKRLERHLFTSI